VVVAAKVNGVVRDLRRPVSPDDIRVSPDGQAVVNVELVFANTAEGKAVTASAVLFEFVAVSRHCRRCTRFCGTPRLTSWVPHYKSTLVMVRS
jgi:hypothetical protein